MFTVPGAIARLALVVSVGLTLSACGGADGLTLTENGSGHSLFGSLPSEGLLDKGKRYYRDGDYGLAEQAFRKAIEEDKNNAEAWLGLAASYDRLQRFDLAERAYKVLVKMVGNTPAVLNNLGYHHMLRGDYATARKTLVAAQKADPDNVFVRNNLALIEEAKSPTLPKTGRP